VPIQIKEIREMRNSMKSMLMATAVVAGLGASASAAITFGSVQNDILLGTYRGGGPQGGAPFLTFQVGDLTLKYVNYDVGQLYTPTSGTFGRAANPGLTNAAAIAAMDAVPNATPASFNLRANEDSWGILTVTEIFQTATGNRLWSAAVAPYEITGMFWGEQDTYLNAVNASTQEIHGVNFKLAFFADDTPDFNATGGPSARGAGSFSYPTVTDTTLPGPIWTLNGFPGSADTNFPLDEFLTTFNPAAGPGAPNVGNGMVDADFGTNGAGTGGLNNMFQLKPGADASIKFTGITPSGAFNGWAVQSNDPLVATAISVPAPSAIWGGALLAGLMGVQQLRRRRAAN